MMKLSTVTQQVAHGGLWIEQLDDRVVSESCCWLKNKGRHDNRRKILHLRAETLHQLSFLSPLKKISPYSKIHQHQSGSRDTTNVLYTTHAAALKNENRFFSGPDETERILFSRCFLKVVSNLCAAYASRAPAIWMPWVSWRYCQTVPAPDSQK